jgi:hypothetical protein
MERVRALGSEAPAQNHLDSGRANPIQGRFRVHPPYTDQRSQDAQKVLRWPDRNVRHLMRDAEK